MKRWWRRGDPGYRLYSAILVLMWLCLAAWGATRHDHILLVWASIAVFYRVGEVLEA